MFHNKLFKYLVVLFFAVTGLTVLQPSMQASAVTPNTSDRSIFRELKTYPRNAAVNTDGSVFGDDFAFRMFAKFNPDGYNCDVRADTGHIDFTGGGGRDLWTEARVTYQFCWPDDPDRLFFVEPEYTRVSYNIEGTHFNCSKYSLVFTYLEANMNFYRKSTGANFNPGSFNVPCDESTRNAVTQFYTHREVPRLYVDADGTTPIAKANITIHKVGPDEHKGHGWHFNP